MRAPSGQARIDVSPNDPVTELFEKVTERFKLSVSSYIFNLFM